MLADQYHFSPPVHEAVEHVFPPGVKKEKQVSSLDTHWKAPGEGRCPTRAGSFQLLSTRAPLWAGKEEGDSFPQSSRVLCSCLARRLHFINAPSFNVCLAYIKTHVSGMGCHHVVAGSGNLRAEDPHFSLNFCPWLGWRIDSLPCCFLSFCSSGLVVK